MSEATRTKIIGGLVLVVTGWGLYQVLKLTSEPVKKSDKLDGYKKKSASKRGTQING